MYDDIIIGVLVSGRGTNLQSIIDSIEDGRLNAEIGIVISDNPEAKALDRAEKYDLNNTYIGKEDFATTADYEARMVEVLEENEVELVAMAGFMTFLSSYFIDQYRNRIMNIHPSLLPAFPGPNAQEQALDYGVKISGCTVHFADEGIDSGPVILQEAVPVLEGDTVESLSRRILAEEHRIYPKAIQLFANGRLVVKDGKVEIL
ncbi:phosphoribosylglycinamide formyltransferase [Fuchsiella alkaliacetigena]|uniref:phosphoribosylglycinamide formyltransferase n=1 Tax=Fuchsiella alkaliacetigena TaxID=957042 RepID=UPI00200B9776|nr:phosphoribosylglycinamide formyltransferase [Fuchsiella alkaliacetigena]MCK8824956.1 phosphoribosylglycinamide formyltransferase [Fuchsiella alkaliacetigena]